MQIGLLARTTGVSPRLLRYYEQQGLLHPGRTATGYRQYGADAVATDIRIRTLLAAGLTTPAIKRMLECVDDDQLDPITPVVAACPEMIRMLIQERARQSEAIDKLDASRRRLDDLLAAAPAAVRLAGSA